MKKLVYCEFIKIIKNKSNIIAFLFPLVFVIFGLVNIYNLGVYNLSNTQKLDVIYNQNALIYGGVCLGIFTSYIISMQWRNEYKNNAINNVLVTPVKRESYCISQAIVRFIIIFTN
ncbi:MAG: ABC transporter permease, partial [Paraclostridium sp.]